MPWNTCFYPRIGVLLFNWILTDYTQQASQWLSVWRSNYGSTAIAIIACFLSLEYKPVKGEIKDVDELEDTDELEDADVPGKDTDERRSPQEICGDFMTGLAFLFKDLEAKLENTFQSSFVLQLLGHTHLRPCFGCPDIPKLNTTALKAHGIKGALSLCCAAVSCACYLVDHTNVHFQLECALHLIQRGDIDIDDQISTRGKATMKTPLKFNKVTGKESSIALLFSEQNWGSCTHEYFMSINKHDVTALKEIDSMASALNTSILDGILSEDGSCQDNAMADEQMAVVGQCKNLCRNCIIFL